MVAAWLLFAAAAAGGAASPARGGAAVDARVDARSAPRVEARSVSRVDARSAPLIDTRSAPLWVFATHHKTGTHLFREFAAALAATLGPSVPVANGYRKHRRLPPRDNSSVLFHPCFDAEGFADLVASGRDFRVAHVVRDPVALVVSAYAYHLHSNDTQLVPDVRPTTLAKMSLEAGLAHEARGDLRSTLPEILSALEATRGDARVLTVGLEDFEDDFVRAATRVQAHLLRPYVSGALPLDSKWRSADAATKNIGDHRTPDDVKTEAVAVIERSKDAVWDQVRAYRTTFGYGPKTLRLGKDWAVP
ncbi:hypothetical protein M885DRAFT_202951 [Pelagophyceae sp. CCMP2097]|nr:hypothetical protein M885DRAFT_202951 [Pelagophyceae sp. CCMP2097]